MTAPDPVLPVDSPEPTHDRRVQTVGVAMYLAAAALFAFNGTVSKAALNAGLDPVRITEIRNAGSAVVLLVVLLLTSPRALRVRRAEFGFLLLYGVVAFALVQFLYFVTISRLPVGIGTLLSFLAPVVVALWLRFGRGQPVRRRVWAALALTVVGLALVAEVWRGIALDGLGLLAGLATAVALSLYWLLGEAGQRRRDPVSLTFWGFVFATAAWSIVAPWWTFPWSVLGTPAQPVAGGPGIPVWALVVWMVLLGTVVPFLLVLGSLGRIGSQRAGIVGTTEPVWATLIAFLLLGETVTGVQVVGGLVVLGAVLLAETARQPAH